MQIPVTGARCTIVWVIRDDNAPYWRTHNFLMGHIKFYGAMARPKVISELFRRGQFYWWRKPLTCRKSLKNFIT